MCAEYSEEDCYVVHLGHLPYEDLQFISKENLQFQ